MENYLRRSFISSYHQVEDQGGVHSDGLEQQRCVTAAGFVSQTVQLFVVAPASRQQLGRPIGAAGLQDEATDTQLYHFVSSWLQMTRNAYNAEQQVIMNVTHAKGQIKSKKIKDKSSVEKSKYNNNQSL